jgi:hypothetical protein
LIKSRLKVVLVLIAMSLLFCSLGTGCAPGHDFDRHLRAITKPYRFSIVKWELNAFGEGVREAFADRQKEANAGVSEVTEYFATMEQIRSLESEIEAVRAGNGQGDLASLEDELSRLQKQNTAVANAIERLLETQIKETLSEQGIYNPIDKYTRIKVGFPPVNFKLGRPPHLLVVSPRDRIESMREVALLPGLGPEDMASIENKVDKFGVSSLVVEVGGLATYPSYITDKGDLRFTLDTATEEWLHKYLTFKPLGFRYLLDLTGICRNYEIATMNETLAGMVSQEIGSIIYESHYARSQTDNAKPPATGAGFDFNQEMREIRRAVDSCLAQGEIEQAEEFMEQKRQFLATKGYYIRKLNQAYFAFHGTYADRPTSISPIGVELKKLRSRSESLKEFLETVAAMTSRQDLAESVR